MVQCTSLLVHYFRIRGLKSLLLGQWKKSFSKIYYFHNFNTCPSRPITPEDAYINSETYSFFWNWKIKSNFLSRIKIELLILKLIEFILKSRCQIFLKYKIKKNFFYEFVKNLLFSLFYLIEKCFSCFKNLILYVYAFAFAGLKGSKYDFHQFLLFSFMIHNKRHWIRKKLRLKRAKLMNTILMNYNERRQKENKN